VKMWVTWEIGITQYHRHCHHSIERTSYVPFTKTTGGCISLVPFWKCSKLFVESRKYPLSLGTPVGLTIYIGISPRHLGRVQLASD